jgi:pimeloyl-ACP methyl ester carboxylesterase
VNNYTKIYKESEIKIVAPLIDNIVTFDNNTIFFMLDSSFIFSNKNDTINVSLSYIEDSLSSRVIDFNNNSLFSISFNQNGISNILAKIKINGMFLQSFFLFKSYRTLISEQSFEITPDNYRTIGRVTIKYGCGNTSGKIRKPFVFVEGFDPGLDAGERDNYGRLNWDIFSNWNNLGDSDHDGIPDYQNLQKAKNLVNKLNADGFDIIYLEFKNSTKPLLDNAKVVVSLLNYINTYHQPKHKIILAGGSMGGLLTKIALNLMEQNNEIHRVRDWITFDSPHRGANIPLGDQMFVYFFSTGTKPQSEAIEAVNILKTPAAQQMLIYHYLGFGEKAKIYFQKN